MQFLVLGNKEHGKDAISTFISEAFGLSYSSTSYFALESFLFDEMQESGDFPYTTVQEAYEARNNHREYFYDAIQAYNSNCQSKLADALLDKYSGLCGIRHKDELDALLAKRDIPLRLWVDASGRKPLESKSSISITEESATHVINNNDSFEAACSQVWNIFTREFETNPVTCFQSAYQAAR